MCVNRFGRCVAAALAVLLWSTGPASGQTTSRASLSLAVGSSGGGTARSLEKVLRTGGLDETPPFGGFLGGLGDEHPISYPDASFGFELRVRIRPRVSVGIAASESNSGSSHGYSLAPGFSEITFDADYSVSSIAAPLNWHVNRRLRIGAGPAIHKARLRPTGSDADLTATKFGWVAQIGFAFFDGKRFFSEITTDYRAMGSLEMPSVTLNDHPFLGTAPRTLTLPATSVNYRHWVVGLSLGVKIP